MPGKVCQKIAVFLFSIIGLLFVLSVLLLLNLSVENFLLFTLVPPIAVVSVGIGLFLINRVNKRCNKQKL
jgi:hypothetical protein